MEVDWLQMRAGKFTASEIHKLLVSGRKKGEVFGETALSYINKKAVECLVPLTLIPKVESVAMGWGKENEEEANEEYSNRYIFDGRVEYFGGSNPKFFPLEGHEDFAGCSPDAIQNGSILIEYKNPYQPEVHMENLLMTAEEFKDKRKEYYAQIQFNLMCLGLEKARFVSYDKRFSDPNKRLAVIEIDKDEEFCNNLMERLELAEERLQTILNTLEHGNDN